MRYDTVTFYGIHGWPGLIVGESTMKQVEIVRKTREIFFENTSVSKTLFRPVVEILLALM